VWYARCPPWYNCWLHVLVTVFFLTTVLVVVNETYVHMQPRLWILPVQLLCCWKCDVMMFCLMLLLGILLNLLMLRFLLNLLVLWTCSWNTVLCNHQDFAKLGICSMVIFVCAGSFFPLKNLFFVIEQLIGGFSAWYLWVLWYLCVCNWQLTRVVGNGFLTNCTSPSWGVLEFSYELWLPTSSCYSDLYLTENYTRNSRASSKGLTYIKFQCYY
jgi:hypothetical protein